MVMSMKVGVEASIFKAHAPMMVESYRSLLDHGLNHQEYSMHQEAMAFAFVGTRLIVNVMCCTEIYFEQPPRLCQSRVVLHAPDKSEY